MNICQKSPVKPSGLGILLFREFLTMYSISLIVISLLCLQPLSFWWQCFLQFSYMSLVWLELPLESGYTYHSTLKNTHLWFLTSISSSNSLMLPKWLGLISYSYIIHPYPQWAFNYFHTFNPSSLVFWNFSESHLWIP